MPKVGAFLCENCIFEIHFEFFLIFFQFSDKVLKILCLSSTQLKRIFIQRIDLMKHSLELTVSKASKWKRTTKLVRILNSTL